MSKHVHTLKTERLILREIRESDAAQIVAWRSAPDVYQFFKSPHALTEAEHLRWYRNSYLPDANRVDWMCLEAETEKPVGVFSLRKVPDASETVEVSYLTAPDAQRKGYAAEAIRALVSHAAEVWNAQTVIAEIHADNTPSIRLVEKLGFTLREKAGLFSLYCLDVSRG